MKLIYIILFVIAVLFLSCKTDNEYKAKNIGYSDNTAFSKSFFEVLDKTDEIFLEVTDSSLIGEIEDIILLPNKNLIIILDRFISQSIFLFDFEGNFIRNIGSKGKGPGELLKPVSIAYGNDLLIVYSADLFKLLFYKLNGDFVKEIQLSKEKCYFSFDKMIADKKNLYGYTQNKFYNKNCIGDECKVLVLENYSKFSQSYGKEETMLNISLGDLVKFGSKIIFSNSFDGKIYYIDFINKEVRDFLDLGILYDVKELERKENYIKFYVENIQDIDAITRLGVIKDLLFIERKKRITVVNSSGNQIENLKWSIEIPQGFEGLSSRAGFLFYDDGVILPSTDKSKITEITAPNPTLIFYKLNKEWYNRLKLK